MIVDAMVRAAVARAGYDPAVVEGVRDAVCFHILMSHENATPERIGLLVEELLPGMAAALAEETRAAGLRLTISDRMH